jgi:hypothetical protein
MLTLFFVVMMISVFGRLLMWGIKAAWGLGKMIFSLVFLPIILIGMACAGMVYIALAVLVVGGIITFVGSMVA